MGVIVYAVGLVSLSACVPADLPLPEVERQVNEKNPTGVGPWKVSDAPMFADGTHTNPCLCEHDDSRIHRLLHC